MWVACDISFVWVPEESLGGHWFRSNKEVEVAIHEELWMQEPDF
jgi:hypothetical protein